MTVATWAAEQLRNFRKSLASESSFCSAQRTRKPKGVALSSEARWAVIPKKAQRASLLSLNVNVQAFVARRRTNFRNISPNAILFTYVLTLRSSRKNPTQSTLSEVEGCECGGTSHAKLDIIRILSADEEFDYAQNAFVLSK